MDPLTLAISTILGKYAIDKGATLLKEAGQAAANAAGKLFEKVMQRLKADPAEAKNAEHFERNPEGYKIPISDAIDEKLKADPNLAAELRSLVEEFQRASGTTIINTGSGAVATHGGVAAGAGGVAVGGNVGGSLVTGNNNRIEDKRQTINRSGGVDISGTANITGDVTGRDDVKSDK